MMNKYLGVILLVLILNGCHKSNKGINLASENFILSPIMDVTFNELSSLGYNKIDSLGLFTKSYGNVVVSYHFLNDKSSIFTRNILVNNVDSVQAINWIQEQNGVICSSPENINSNNYVFFVLDRYSGLYLKATVFSNCMVINFNYPNIGKEIRTENRTINKNGNIIVEGINNSGNLVTFSY